MVQPKIPSRNALCVGATGGIGKAIALHLASCQVNVTVAGRNKDAGNQVVRQLESIHPTGRHAFVECDASLMSNIRKVTGHFGHQPLHYLVLTQGVASLNGRTETAEGIDRKMALHYYGRILFIQCLLGQLNETAKNEDVRVMSVLSAGVHSPYTKLDDMELKDNFSLSNAAAAAGFYTDLALDHLARENPNITFVHAAPGIVRTAWGDEFPSPFRQIVGFLKKFATDPADCAKVLCRGLLDDPWRGGFRLMSAKATPASKTKMHTNEIMAKVWAHTVKLLGGTSPK